ncbi:MAG: metal ABC transporter substrate-binding protein [Oscillospiraceae bacterium]|jgi:zinc transport system substrate-binding protein|nr:metal ABC transporter substrate-binding protein [Oscillospiraceae bacterium]
MLKAKLIAVLLAGLLLLTAAGCKSDDAKEVFGEDGKISVISTIFAPFDFAREIAGDMADIRMLLPLASEIHSFEPSPQDIIDITNCDVFIYVGGESETWVEEQILASIDLEGKQVISLMDCVETVDEEIVEGMEEEEEEEEEGEGAPQDEHVWTAPKNAKLIVQKITDALCAQDSANADAFRQNSDSYQTRLDALDAELKDVTDGAARKTVVFGDRFPFRYLADAYGLKYFAAFPGCSEVTEPKSPATVAFLINKVKEEQLPAVFYIELSNQRIADTIVEDTGAKKLLLHSCHNLTKADFDGGATYISLMQANVQALKEALW